jgi:hypothetical protein
MKRIIFLISLLTIIIFSCTFGTAFGEEDDCTSKNLRKEKKFEVPFFDGIKFQITNSNPKLTNASHKIHDLNAQFGTDLDDWDDIDIFTLDLVLWRDLSRYFKTDFAIAGTVGELTDSDTGSFGPFSVPLRMRQRYSVLMFWTNLYYYPFKTNCRSYKSGNIIEPFIAGGLGYTFFRSESTFKFRGDPTVGLDGRIRNNWNGNDWAFKMMTGFNINPGNINPKLEGWVVTFSAFYIWNRMKGHSSYNYSSGLNPAFNSILGNTARMDIDLTGYNFSLAIGHYF